MKSIPIRRIKSSQMKQPLVGRFSIRALEQVINGKDLAHEQHKHDFFFILALKKGTGIHEIDFVEYKVHDNSIFILRPGQIHKLELSAESQGFLMEFDSSFYQPANRLNDHPWKKAISRNYCEVQAARFQRVFTLLNDILNEFTIKEHGFVEAIKANLDLFFIEYIRQSSNPHSNANSLTPYLQERFEDLLRLLELNIGNIKSASGYASLLNLSPYQLNAISKASVGKTVSDLINEQIILEAKRNLLGTANQVKEIADQLGYEDVSYFIRFFRKHTGLTPDVFRKNFK